MWGVGKAQFTIQQIVKAKSQSSDWMLDKLWDCQHMSVREYRQHNEARLTETNLVRRCPVRPDH